MEYTLQLMIGIVLGSGICFGNSFIRGLAIGVFLVATLVKFQLITIV